MMTKAALEAAVNARLGQIEDALAPLDDEQAVAMTALFPTWAPGVSYALDERRQWKNLLYKCIQPHTSQDGQEPPAVPALWVRCDTEEWPEWRQPQGAHDGYDIGAKCSHKGKHWINEYPKNTFEPGVYGWREVTE